MQGVSIVVTDLTEQKRQQELVASEQLLRSIMDQAAEGHSCLRRPWTNHSRQRRHELCGCNPVFQSFDEILSLSHASIEESPAGAKETTQPDTLRLTFGSILEKKELRSAEAVFHRSDGQVVDLLVSAGLVRDLKGNMLGCVVTLIDITERKKAEEERKQLLSREQTARAQAETANRFKDEFIATVSHELRTPLNAMFGWTQLLRAGKLDAPTSARAVEIIDQNARSQAKLIDDLLDISRIITGKMRLDVQLLQLAPIIETVRESVSPAAEAKGVRLHTILDPRPAPCPVIRIGFSKSSGICCLMPSNLRKRADTFRSKRNGSILISRFRSAILEKELARNFFPMCLTVFDRLILPARGTTAVWDWDSQLFVNW